MTSPVAQLKRSKTITSPDPRDKPCVICNYVKCQGDTKRFRIESSEVADRSLKAANFNKNEIHIWLIFLKETGDVWAKDIMYRNNCMNKYISKFQRDIEKLLADDFENPEKSNHIEEAFNDVTGSLDIGTNGYALSDVRDTLNKKLKCHDKAWLFSKYLDLTLKGIEFQIHLSQCTPGRPLFTQSETKRRQGLHRVRRLYGWKSY